MRAGGACRARACLGALALGGSMGTALAGIDLPAIALRPAQADRLDHGLGLHRALCRPQGHRDDERGNRHQRHQFDQLRGLPQRRRGSGGHGRALRAGGAGGEAAGADRHARHHREMRAPDPRGAGGGRVRGDGLPHLRRGRADDGFDRRRPRRRRRARSKPHRDGRYPVRGPLRGRAGPGQGRSGQGRADDHRAGQCRFHHRRPARGGTGAIPRAGATMSTIRL